MKREDTGRVGAQGGYMLERGTVRIQARERHRKDTGLVVSQRAYRLGRGT